MTKARMEQFIKEILDSHNAYRKRHQAPALRLSQDLTESAQSWAEHIAGNDKLEHDTQCQKDKIGENVAMKYSSVHSDFPGNLFTDYWYREIEDYNFEGNVEDQIQCGHFTQVVWKASEEVGFGRAVSKSGRVYVVSRYRPAGNYMGEFGKNVLPPADGKIVLPETEQGKTAPMPGAKLEAVIGPNDPADQLVGTRMSTKTSGNKKTVMHTETYRTPEGNTYTKERETTSTVQDE
ncbi:hypothetical protein BOX15_Mlig027945g1 [Macrostomum lignano]|uniref:SCP domain-containing protein n=2 Tax=Macrostomum lignano TaxID=282301 RepID=A0A267DLK9_9PLAT|nr:hypothetical protein BOX15_Mlig027945g1 [Macrostomum lignano]